MKRDYNRAICNECAVKGKCEEYRNKNWCINCQLSLLCLMKRNNTNILTCKVIRAHWQTLPNACLLADKLMRLYPRDNECFIKNEEDYKMCPRCLNIFNIINEWYNYVYGRCTFCGAMTPCIHFFKREWFPEKQYAK